MQFVNLILTTVLLGQAFSLVHTQEEFDGGINHAAIQKRSVRKIQRRAPRPEYERVKGFVDLALRLMDVEPMDFCTAICVGEELVASPNPGYPVYEAGKTECEKKCTNKAPESVFWREIEAWPEVQERLKLREERRKAEGFEMRVDNNPILGHRPLGWGNIFKSVIRDVKKGITRPFRFSGGKRVPPAINRVRVPAPRRV